MLIGGGHANIQVIKKLCMNEYVGLHTILINKGYYSYYSGMTPGYIQKKYSKEEISIDLQRLCINAGVTFINDEVIGIDTYKKEIFLKESPFIKYDLLSINSGAKSKSNDILLEENKKTFFSKPINSLIENISTIDQELLLNSSKKVISIIGGGVAAFEIAISLCERYKRKVKINLISTNILKEKNINKYTKIKLVKLIKLNEIEIIKNRVIKINKDSLTLQKKKKIKSDFNILATGAVLEKWLNTEHFDKDGHGFIIVDEHLLSLRHKDIFLSGDIVTIKNQFRPKSGVMAVRQGQVLKENIFLKIQNRQLKKFIPQKNWLYLITSTNNKAILNYYFFTIEGSFVWKLKKFIDVSFIKKFKAVNQLMNKKKYILLNLSNHEMHCQGCGSKVSKKNLIDYLKSLNFNNELPDASIINFKQKKILQTIDQIKHFSYFNPFDFGRISYFHSLNDILASGGSVHSYSISIGVPYSEDKVEDFFLRYFVEGIKLEANKDRSLMKAGHSYQTDDPSTTIVMNGDFNKPYSKNKAKINDLIYLTKPLGSGYLLKAYYQYGIHSDQLNIKEIIQNLLKNNKAIINFAMKYKSYVMTDISGFGLASHLSDICLASNLSAEIKLSQDFLINKNISLLQNYKSSGYENNYNLMKKEIEIDESNIFQNILYDPQTNGPILFALDPKFKLSFEKEFKNKYQSNPLLLGSFIKKKEKSLYINN